MTDFSKDSGEDERATDSEPSNVQRKVEVGDEVHVDITCDSMDYTLWEAIEEHIGVIRARWKSPDGPQWAVVQSERIVDKARSPVTRQSDYLGCLFLARQCSLKDPGMFRAMCG
jgi:hypothetical protein